MLNLSVGYKQHTFTNIHWRMSVQFVRQDKGGEEDHVGDGGRMMSKGQWTVP